MSQDEFIEIILTDEARACKAILSVSTLLAQSVQYIFWQSMNFYSSGIAQMLMNGKLKFRMKLVLWNIFVIKIGLKEIQRMGG